MAVELTLRCTDKVALIDEADVEKAAGINWYLSTADYVYGYFGNNEKRLLHRFLLDVTDSKVQVDHKNRNPLDCTRDNLRLCTNRQNTGNSDKRTTNTSGYKGVCWSEKYKGWRATITNHGKPVHIGYFDVLETAARAYDKAAIAVFGEFAYLNFPDEDNSNFDDGIVRRQPPTSTRKGVRLGRYNRWIARARGKDKGERHYLGSFDTEQEAIAAIEAAEEGL